MTGLPQKVMVNVLMPASIVVTSELGIHFMYDIGHIRVVTMQDAIWHVLSPADLESGSQYACVCTI